MKSHLGQSSHVQNPKGATGFTYAPRAIPSPGISHLLPEDGVARGWTFSRTRSCFFQVLQCYITVLNFSSITSFNWGMCTRRAGQLYRTRTRLYRSGSLQPNIRWKPLAEIYTIHSFAPLCNRIFVFQKFDQSLLNFERNVLMFPLFLKIGRIFA